MPIQFEIIKGWIPVAIFEDRPWPPFRAMTRIAGPFVWINIDPDYCPGGKCYTKEEFDAIMAHEKQHARDFYANFPLYWFKYRKPEDRKVFEARGFARQFLAYLDQSEARLIKLSTILSQRYELEISVSEARREIINQLSVFKRFRDS